MRIAPPPGPDLAGWINGSKPRGGGGQAERHFDATTLSVKRGRGEQSVNSKADRVVLYVAKREPVVADLRAKAAESTSGVGLVLIWSTGGLGSVLTMSMATSRLRDTH